MIVLHVCFIFNHVFCFIKIFRGTTFSGTDALKVLTGSGRLNNPEHRVLGFGKIF